jgi:hypothetical protein
MRAEYAARPRVANGKDKQMSDHNCANPACPIGCPDEHANWDRSFAPAPPANDAGTKGGDAAMQTQFHPTGCSCAICASKSQSGGHRADNQPEMSADAPYLPSVEEVAQFILKPHWPVVRNTEENEARQKEMQRISLALESYALSREQQGWMDGYDSCIEMCKAKFREREPFSNAWLEQISLLNTFHCKSGRDWLRKHDREVIAEARLNEHVFMFTEDGFPRFSSKENRERHDQLEKAECEAKVSGCEAGAGSK